MKPVKPKKRWTESDRVDRAAGAEVGDVTEAADGVERLDLEEEEEGGRPPRSRSGQRAAAAAPTHATLPPPPPPPPPTHIDAIGDLGRLEIGQNAHITPDLSISRVASLATLPPVSEASSSTDSSPFR